MQKFAYSKTIYSKIDHDILQIEYKQQKGGMLKRGSTMKRIFLIAALCLITVMIGAHKDARQDLISLIQSIREHNIPEASRLLHNGVDVNAKWHYGMTPLIVAATQNNPHMVLMLLKEGADPNVCDDHGKTALMLTSNGDITKILLFVGAESNAQDHDGMTPLMLMTALNVTDAIRPLLEAGADMYAKNNSGKSALDYARKNPEILTIFDTFLVTKNQEMRRAHAKHHAQANQIERQCS